MSEPSELSVPSELAESQPFYSRKWVRPDALNAHGTIHGGALLHWIDEEAALFAIMQLGTQRLVTKSISSVNFQATAKRGDVIEAALTVTKFGRTSITIKAEVRNLVTDALIITIDAIVFVCVGEDGRPVAHGQSEPARGRERLPHG